MLFALVSGLLIGFAASEINTRNNNFSLRNQLLALKQRNILLEDQMKDIEKNKA